MNQPAPALLELQRAIRQNLLHGTDAKTPACILADGLDPAERLGIYRNTAHAVFATALRLSFPAVQHLVGPEFFDGAARLFAAEAPPRSAWLDEYGAAFPEFLERLPQAASLPYLADVARLEWQVNLVLHAPNARPLDLARFAQLDDAALAGWRFERHPAVRLLQCAVPADAIWRAVLERDESAMAAVDLADGPVWLLVQRTESGIDMVHLDACDWRFTAALFSGQPLQEALKQAPGADARTCLAAHLARGCFADSHCAGKMFSP